MGWRSGGGVKTWVGGWVDSVGLLCKPHWAVKAAMWRPVVMLTVVAVVTVTANPVKRQVGVSDDILFTTIDNNEATKSGSDVASSDPNVQGGEIDLRTEMPPDSGDVPPKGAADSESVAVRVEGDTSPIDVPTLPEGGIDNPTDGTGNEGAVIPEEGTQTDGPVLLEAGTENPKEGTVIEGAESPIGTQPEEPMLLAAETESPSEGTVIEEALRQEVSQTEEPMSLAAETESPNEGTVIEEALRQEEDIQTDAPSFLEAGTDAPIDVTVNESGALRAEEVPQTEELTLPETVTENATEDIGNEATGNEGAVRINESEQTMPQNLLEGEAETEPPIEGTGNEGAVRIQVDILTESPTISEDETVALTDGTGNEGAVRVEEGTLETGTEETPAEGAGNEVPQSEVGVRLEEPEAPTDLLEVVTDAPTEGAGSEVGVRLEEPEAPTDLLEVGTEAPTEGAGSEVGVRLEEPEAPTDLLEVGTEAPTEGAGSEVGVRLKEPEAPTDLLEVVTEAPTEGAGSDVGVRLEEISQDLIPTDLLEVVTDAPTEGAGSEVGVRLKEPEAPTDLLEVVTEAPTEGAGNEAPQSEVGVRKEEISQAVIPTDLLEVVTNAPTEGAGNEASVLIAEEGTLAEEPTRLFETKTDPPNEVVIRQEDIQTRAPIFSELSEQGVGAVVVSVNGEALTEFSNPDGPQKEDMKAGQSKDVNGEAEGEEYWLMMNQNQQSKDETKSVDEKFEKVAEKYGLKPAKTEPVEDEHTYESDIQPQPREAPVISATNQLPSFTDRVARFVGKIF
ncbi:hypothetical protein Pmani_000868 [Petrolisthes manimaculis]|uniref:Uncharacterized protein n=1 Tax=Petrolisthes manimaculis TaxID=1843537 RepID=A0AAE1US81_9EUCA|nr:hypothetical protein Pmani_000868 [Petrolisthes manimaculis]